MLFFLVSFLSFLLFTKPLILKLLPSWVSEMRLLLVLLCQEAFNYSFQWLKSYRFIAAEILNLKFPLTMFVSRTNDPIVENVEEMNVLDLPELPLECILGKLSPSGLCTMTNVCTSLRDRCRSDRLWEKHMKEKWTRVIGKAAQKEWESCRGSTTEHNSSNGLVRPRWWMESLSCVWPCSWFKPKQTTVGDLKTQLPTDSVMALYLSLERGRFWFPAQVYNREQSGHAGFMLSCYDAELSYDSQTDTFHARYPPHGQKLTNTEEGLKWERLRAPPVDTPAYELHLSGCLNDLRPGDHIEIQWRKNKEFPYGWWYGVVGHLESCNGNENHCLCFHSDTVLLEFKQYTPDSRWRCTTVNRKDHREEGNEIDGFYGGIRKLYDTDVISMWRQLWPTKVLE